MDPTPPDVNVSHSKSVNKSRAELLDDVSTHTIPHLIIGSGVAGLMLALKLARYDQVVVIAKGKLENSNSWYAQGGIASVLDKEDSFDRHIQDTHTAGAGLCHPDIVDLVVRSGPKMIEELLAFGVPLIPLGKRHTKSQKFFDHFGP